MKYFENFKFVMTTIVNATYLNWNWSMNLYLVRQKNIYM